MKSVLISIQPKWCELIASGKKTVEVRKTRPKLETPFKVYIYQTIDGGAKYDRIVSSGLICGKVIGEFVCDEILTLWSGYAGGNGDDCLTFDERECYLGFNEDGSNRMGYGWHISDLVIYDNPRELSEFKTNCTKFYDGKPCGKCIYFIDGRGYEYDESDCGCDGLKPITRPFQSWGYVESEDVK